MFHFKLLYNRKHPDLPQNSCYSKGLCLPDLFALADASEIPELFGPFISMRNNMLRFGIAIYAFFKMQFAI